MVKRSPQPYRPSVDNAQRQLRKPRFSVIKYTYFAAVANYPKSGYKVKTPLMISQKILGGQLFKQTDTDRRVVGNLVKEFEGWIPFDTMMNLLNELFNAERADSNEQVSFTEAFKNWEYKWEIGYARYKFGERYANTEELTRKNKKGKYLYRIGGKKDGKAVKVYPRELMTDVQDMRRDKQGEVPQFNWEKDETGTRKKPKRKSSRSKK